MPLQYNPCQLHVFFFLDSPLDPVCAADTFMAWKPTSDLILSRNDSPSPRVCPLSIAPLLGFRPGDHLLHVCQDFVQVTTAAVSSWMS